MDTARIKLEHKVQRSGESAYGPGIADVPAEIAEYVAKSRGVTVAALIRECEEEEARNRATEAALALAEEHGVDLTTVEGTGAGGRIVVGDVQALLPADEEAPADVEETETND